jgi:hypothetical protein
MSRRLDELDSELERAVFKATYESYRQRRWRLTAGLLLVLKHALRGVAFSWPLYLLAIGALLLPDSQTLMFAVLLLTGVVVSGYVLTKGIREEYREHVRGVILKSGDIRRMLFPRA